MRCQSVRLLVLALSFVLLCLVAAAMAAPPSGDENIGTGDYKYAFERSDGNKAEAVSEFHAGGKDNEGSHEYVGSDGVKYTNYYDADENGLHPVLTQGPNGAIPDEIIKAFSSK